MVISFFIRHLAPQRSYGILVNLNIFVSRMELQEGVISPILFYLYIDRLLLHLQRSDLECHISNTYMGGNPSLYGLNVC